MLVQINNGHRIGDIVATEDFELWQILTIQPQIDGECIFCLQSKDCLSFLYTTANEIYGTNIAPFWSTGSG